MLTSCPMRSRSTSRIRCHQINTRLSLSLSLQPAAIWMLRILQDGGKPACMGSIDVFGLRELSMPRKAFPPIDAWIKSSRHWFEIKIKSEKLISNQNHAVKSDFKSKSYSICVKFIKLWSFLLLFRCSIRPIRWFYKIVNFLTALLTSWTRNITNKFSKTAYWPIDQRRQPGVSDDRVRQL